MIFKNEKEKLVVKSLIERGILPSSGDFDITENILNRYCEEYRLLFGKTSYIPKKTQSSYAKKLASLTLLNLKLNRNKAVITHFEKTIISSTKNGFLYLISNPAFPGYIKVGITKDVVGRLKSYQTYDPLKKYRVEHYTFCEDARSEEKRIINLFSVDIKTGEWVKCEKAFDIYKSVRSMTKD